MNNFYTEAFTNPLTDKPYDVPPDIKTAVIDICNAFNIRGICDPMYIANTIARSIGRGDGKDNFTPIDKVTVMGGFLRSFTHAELTERYPGWQVVSEQLKDGQYYYTLEKLKL